MREYQEIHENTSYVGGPQVAAFEARFANFSARAVSRVERHRRAPPGSARHRNRARRRGDHDTDDVYRDRRGDRAGRCAAGFRGCRSEHRQSERPEIARYLERARFTSPQRPARDTAGASLRPTGCDDRIARSRASLRPEGRRGCVPGAWRSRQLPGAIALRRHDRNDGLLQFLSRQEPGRMGRRRRGRHQRRRAGRTQIRTLRDHGRLSHYAHSAYGYNARLDTIQAAVLRPKLERLEEWNARRRRLAAIYRDALRTTA